MIQQGGPGKDFKRKGKAPANLKRGTPAKKAAIEGKSSSKPQETWKKWSRK